MMTISILLKAYALTLRSIHWPLALGCWTASILLDAQCLRKPSLKQTSSSRAPYTGIMLLNAGALVVGLSLCAAFFEATLRWKSGLHPAAKAVEWLFALLKLPSGAFRGSFYTGSMAGPITYPVNLDSLGLILPMTVCATGFVYLLYYAQHWRAVIRGMGWLFLVLVPAALLRWVFAAGLFLALCDFVNYETQDLPIAPFFKPGFIAALYLPFMIIGAVLLHRPLTECMRPDPSVKSVIRSRPRWLWILIGFLLLLVFWEPKGTPKNGTVLINTYHTAWSRTDRPYDRNWYGAASGYNYACLKRLYEGFFEVKELTDRIASEDLDTASVLVIYDPNRSFTYEEIQAVQSFVARGGGLFVIGDHTNVFGSSSHLNQILNGMGFLFRDDVLFDLDEDFFQLKDIPSLHPGILHGIPFFKFRGPASIRATSIFTRNLFTLGNAKSLRAIYSVNNFYPPPHDDPGMWTGDFAVAVSARYGRGRIVGFADSTVFSNFEIFYPGKYEFLLNTAHWLNHADLPVILPLKRIALIGVVVLLGILLFRAGRPRRVLPAVTAVCLMAMAAWSIARLTEQARARFPEPVRPMRFLFFAAEPEDEALTLRSFVTDAPYEQKYDVFIQWVLRANVFSGFHLVGAGLDNTLAGMLSDHDEVDTGLALIATRPEHLDLLDTLTPGPVTTSGRLLLMFSSTLPQEAVLDRLTRILSEAGLAEARAAWPDGTVRLEENGRRTALVFQAEQFSDRQMGFSEKVMPNEIQQALYNRQFELLDWIFSTLQTQPEQDHQIPRETEN